VGYIARAETAQTPEQLAKYIQMTQELLPRDGNPIWLFPTPESDFGMIQSNLQSIVRRANGLSGMDPSSESYNIAIIDIHSSVGTIRTNLLDIIPYTYVSMSNIVLAGLWVTAIIAIFAVLRRLRAITAAIQYSRA
ncbi:MAG: glycosyl transferase, partial [Thermoproteota archaeon]|nr:glycosyl transferase [Thermoproteota archaeon]